MNEVDKNHRPELRFDVPASVDHLAFNTCMYFSRHCYSLSSLAQLDSGCVCACSCAEMCIYACQSLKFEGWTMLVMVWRQYFQFMSCEGSAMQ